MQSRAMSLVESIANIVVGFVVAVLAQMIVFPLFGIEASFAQNLGVGIAFTAVSLARSYFLRRMFDGLSVKTTGEVRLDEDEIDIPGAESAGVPDSVLPGSPGGDEVATVRACQCTPMTAISAQQAGHRVDAGQKGGIAMHAVVRSYSGKGAKELFDVLEKRKTDVESLIRSVKGFVSYSLIRTADGGVSVTVCNDKAGTDESLQKARDWIKDNASNIGGGAPTVSEGPIILQLI